MPMTRLDRAIRRRVAKANVRLVALLVFGWLAAPGEAAEVSVYVLTGQSNSLGTTNVESPTDPGMDPADAETELYWSNVRSTNAVYPPALYGDSGGNITTLQVQQGDGGANPTFWGPEIGFARILADAGLSDVLVVKASRGGGGNGYWDKATFDVDQDAGHMWGHLVDTLDAALAEIVGRGDSFSFKGLMYLQGESNNSTQAAIADTRLADLIDNLRSHVDAVYPGTVNQMHTVVGEIAASGSNASRQLTTQRQMSLADSRPDVTFVGTSDLPLKSDGIHFGRDAKLTIGARFGDALISILEQPNGIAGDVNQDGAVTGDGTGLPEHDDVAALVAGWGQSTFGLTNLAKTQLGDLNLDGKTSLPDAFLLHHALEAEGIAVSFDVLTGAVQAPEPCCAILIGVGAASLVGRRRNRPLTG